MSVSMCLSVYLSGCLLSVYNDVHTTMYARRCTHDVCTNFQDDLDLDELSNDLPSDFLDSCINYANSVVE